MEFAVHTKAFLNKLGVTTLRTHQTEALTALAECKRDVMVILPTGYGKSLIFQSIPHVRPIAITNNNKKTKARRNKRKKPLLLLLLLLLIDNNSNDNAIIGVVVAVKHVIIMEKKGLL